MITYILHCNENFLRETYYRTKPRLDFTCAQRLPLLKYKLIKFSLRKKAHPSNPTILKCHIRHCTFMYAMPCLENYFCNAYGVWDGDWGWKENLIDNVISNYIFLDIWKECIYFCVLIPHKLQSIEELLLEAYAIP